MRTGSLPLLVMTLSAVSLLQAENPLNFQEYTQKIKVQFATPAEAEKAEAIPSSLPNGETIAFSTRWDDNNPRHEKMSQTLKKHGMKGNFYFNRAWDPKFYQKTGKKLLADGNAVGSHTLNHPSLPALTPNMISSQIMMIRPELESALDTTVVTFVLPFCAYSSNVDQRVPLMIRDAINRAGYYTCPEPWPDLANRYQAAPGTIFGTYLFSADDRNPTEKRFDAELLKRIPQAEKNQEVPHITFGLHTWQSDDGFKILERCFDKYNHNPQWWYCNENEYAAYRYQALYSVPRRLKVDGNTVEYEITRFAPHDLGNAIPITLKFNPPPAKVTLDDAELSATAQNLYKLPHNANRVMPGKVEYFQNPANKPLTELTAVSQKFPQLEFGIFYNAKTGKVECRLYNHTNFTMQNIDLAVRLPLKWKKDILYSEIPELKAGSYQELTFDPGPARAEPEFNESAFSILAQCDFWNGKEAGRLYAATTVNQTADATPGVRDCGVFVGPMAKEKITPTLLNELSKPGTKLKNPGSAANEKWATRRQNGNRTFILSVGYPNNQEAMNLSKSFINNDKGLRLCAFDFEVNDVRGFKLFIPAPRDITAVYLNGLRQTECQNGMKIIAAPGKNRLLFVDKARGANQDHAIALAPEYPDRTTIHYLLPETE